MIAPSRPPRRHPTRLAVARATLGGTLMLALLVSPNPLVHGRPASAQTSTQPTIVLILTDDQRWDSLWAMPNVQSQLVAHGVTFDKAFIPNPLCCPSRTSILTGQYSHTTGVYTNSWPYGGFLKFASDGSTIATWLDAAGYQTALIGKYLNEYNSLYVPPGWDRWYAFTGAGTGAAYYRYALNVDGVKVPHGGTVSDYSTDVLASEAERYILSADPAAPMFLMFTPYAPHKPATPAPRHQGAFSSLPPARPPNYNEADISDKPSWVKQLPPMDQASQDGTDLFRQRQYETMLAADDAVGRIVNALKTTGRLSDALIVFMSDNGLANGEHRYTNKKQPYEESIHVPMVIRDDALISAPRTEDRFALNVDIAPTFAEAAGVPAPGAEGVSLMPLLLGAPPPTWRSDFLLEHHLGADDIVPTYCGVRSQRYLYAQYVTGEEELYDLSVDPFELTNMAADPTYRSAVTTLRARMMELCDPLPPDLASAEVTVADFAFNPSAPPVTKGQIVRWNFSGPSQHTVTDASGMDLFDSGPRDAGATFASTFVDAGIYPYACSIHPAMKGKVRVPVTVSPAAGTTSTSFTVVWGAGSTPMGYGADVQVRRPGSTTWESWRTAEAGPTAPFVPDAGAGTYSFRARLRNTANGRSSSWSPAASVTVS